MLDSDALYPSIVPVTIWMTGLPGAGKTTLALALREALADNRVVACVLDGDRIRAGLGTDLSFSAQDRKENIRRIAEVARVLNEQAISTIVACISPYASDRLLAKEIIGTGMREVYVSTPIEECEKRDPKGLYKLARTGTIVSFTGISAPYEPPLTPDLVLDTSTLDIRQCLRSLLTLLDQFNHEPVAS